MIYLPKLFMQHIGQTIGSGGSNQRDDVKIVKTKPICVSEIKYHLKFSH